MQTAALQGHAALNACLHPVSAQRTIALRSSTCAALAHMRDLLCCSCRRSVMRHTHCSAVMQELRTWWDARHVASLVHGKGGAFKAVKEGAVAGAHLQHLQDLQVAVDKHGWLHMRPHEVS